MNPMRKTGSIRAGATHGKEKKASAIIVKTSVSLVSGLSECKKLLAGTKKDRLRFMIVNLTLNSGVAQSKRRGPKIQVASAARYLYFRKLFANCVSL